MTCHEPPVTPRRFVSAFNGRVYWCDALQLPGPPRASCIELRVCDVLPGHDTELEALTCATSHIEETLARWTQEARDRSYHHAAVEVTQPVEPDITSDRLGVAMSRWTPEALEASSELATALGQTSWLDETPAVPEGADFVVMSRTRRGKPYPMLLTPEGIAVHFGEADCEAELFNLACWHMEIASTGQENMTQALIKAENILTPTPIEFDAEQLAVIKNTIAKGASDVELALFVTTCKRTGLDPFMRQIYAVKRYESQSKGMVMGIQVGIDGQRLIAERTEKYDGQDPIEWLDAEGVWSQVWTAVGEFPIAARCSVYRKDWTPGRKATAVCRWDSYAQTYGADHKLMPTWASMPDVMLGKCAESLALRRAFPAEMSAIAALAGQSYDPALEDQGVDMPGRAEAIEGEVVNHGAAQAGTGASGAPPAT